MTSLPHTARLLQLMERLRDSMTGCPWDAAQDFSTIAPYTIEEAYEVADVIAREDWDALPGELGDLLLQVVFHSRMAEEKGWFDFEAVAATITDKMTARHPHVFSEVVFADEHTQKAAWEDQKATERSAKHPGTLDDIPLALPALLRAQKIGKRAARVGFDWTRMEDVRAKLDEELAELDAAIAAKDSAHIEEELGDLLFTCASLARHLSLDAEAALRTANAKFERRFRAMEARAEADNHVFAALTPEAMERYWNAIKAEESPVSTEAP